MIKIRHIFGAVLFCMVLGGVSFAQEAKDKANASSKEREMEKALYMASGAQDKVLKIALVDCILYALKNNSEILIQRIEPKLKEDDIKISESDFSPDLSFDYVLHSNVKTSTSSLSGSGISSYRDIDFNTELSGKFLTGTEYSLEYINERYKSSSSSQTINPYYAVEPKITITQPLLRDFGVLVNKADITVACNNKAESEENFKLTVMDIITKVKAGYYKYVFYLEKYSIDKLSLRRALDLLDANKARYAKGLISSVDMLETEAASARREKELLSTEAELKKAEDDLKLITNLVDDPGSWNAKIELVDTPEFKEEKADLLDALKNAFVYRPDYHGARVSLETKDIKIKTAQNSLLPTLDLVSSFGLNGIGKDYQEAIKKAGLKYEDWSIGFNFSVPFGEENRAAYDQKKLEKVQALIAFKRLEQNIILDVRDKIRMADIQARKVGIAKLSKEKEMSNYQAQQERYVSGQVSTHDILDYQDKLAQAELDYIEAIIDYNVALINLDKSQGLTLVKNDIKLGE